MSAATPRILDMSEADKTPDGDERRTNKRGRLLTAKQIRARARRAVARRDRKAVKSEAADLYKPIEDWDLDELAHGRPKNAAGNFSGRPPTWISREIHEAAMDRFKAMVKQGMNANAVTALHTLDKILGNDECDEKGKPLVPASVKLSAAQYLLDHVVGRATQPTTQEISVKLQGILGAVMVSPAEVEGAFQVGQYATRALPGGSMPEIVLEDDDEDDDGGE